MNTILMRRSQGEASTDVDGLCEGPTFVGRYRYDGLYVVDSASVILVVEDHLLILVQATKGKGIAGYNMCFFELSVKHHGLPTYVC